jgi:hypothetical protein
MISKIGGGPPVTIALPMPTTSDPMTGPKSRIQPVSQANLTFTTKDRALAANQKSSALVGTGRRQRSLAWDRVSDAARLAQEPNTKAPPRWWWMPLAPMIALRPASATPEPNTALNRGRGTVSRWVSSPFAHPAAGRSNAYTLPD